jgi:hypothetical protein
MIYSPNPPVTDRKPRIFQLSPTFLEEFQGKQPAWGPVGYFTYKRTYARKTCDCDVTCNHPTEEFWQTLQRVVEGCFNIQKIHCQTVGTYWHAKKAQRSAQDMFQRMWEFKFTPPGRGLWMMGTDLIFEKGSAALQNCAFVSTDKINEDFAAPFCFLMDMSMLGVGVGGDTRGAGLTTVQVPRLGSDVYPVGDSREGWVEVVRTVLNSFVGKGHYPHALDFSQVRKRGEPIKGFGGIASGAGPLKKLIEGVTRLLLPEGMAVTMAPSDDTADSVRVLFEGEGSAYRIKSTQIVDVFNYIGKCVVAGGVRRTAEIMFGDADDQEFIDLKSNASLTPLYERKAELVAFIAAAEEKGHDTTEFVALLGRVDEQIQAHPLIDRRWASNNSIFGTVGMDYTKVAEAVAAGGEPGIFWLDNARAYSRMSDPPDFKDDRVMGTNPCGEQSLESFELCLSGDTRILTDSGYKLIGDLVGESILVATRFASDEDFTEADSFEEAQVFPTGVKPTLVVTTVDGRQITLTENHPVLIQDEDGFNWVPAGDVVSGDVLLSGASSITGNAPSLDPKFYALGHFLGDGWFLDTNGRTHVGICAGGDEAHLLEGLLPVWDVLVSEAAEFIETAYDDRYNVPLKICRDRNGVLSVGITKPQVYRMLRGKYGFTPGTAPTKRMPQCYWEASPDEKRSFLRGLFDADGCVSNGKRRLVSLTSANEELARDVMLALGEFGIISRMTTHFIQSRGRSQTILHVRGPEMMGLFQEHIWFEDTVHPSKKATKLRELNDSRGAYRRSTNRACVVRSVENGPEVPVFNLEVPGARHYVAEGLVVHNCNLVETYPAHHDDFEDFQKTLKMAYLYAKTVTLVPTHDHRANQVMQYNRRIGCSMSGIVQARQKLGHREFLRWCGEGYDYIRDLDSLYSRWLGVPNSKKMTSVKPSGTVSLLCGATPGIHFPHSEFYLRRVRVANTSPLVEAARKAGYPVEQDTYADDTAVVSFPVKEKHFVKGKREVSIWEQFTLAAAMQAQWADNQVSVTVSFAQSEAKDIATCLATFDDQLKSISMLPLSEHGYVQAPYESITEAEYNQLAARITMLDLSGQDAHDIDAEDKFCSGDSCQIDFTKL